MLPTFSHSDRGVVSLGRAYVLFNKAAAMYDFTDAINGRLFNDDAGKSYVTMVEYAPNQKVPRPTKANPKDGTIKNDKEYKAFLEELENPTPVEPAKVVESNDKEDAFKDSPLLAELRSKIQEKRAIADRKEARRRERIREKETRERARRERENRLRNDKKRELERRDREAAEKKGGKQRGGGKGGGALPKPTDDKRSVGKKGAKPLEHGAVKLMAKPKPEPKITIAKPPPRKGSADMVAPLPKPKGDGGKGASKKGKGGSDGKKKEDGGKKKEDGKKKAKKKEEGSGGGGGAPTYENFLDLGGME